MEFKHFALFGVSIAALAQPVLAQETPISDDGSTTGDSEIVVTGTRGSIIESRKIERDADGIVSAVTSDDVGNFPDQNVAETLQRLPGVSISRAEGEGRFVSVRGLDPAFNNVTVNGVKIGSTEKSDGSVALDIIPSDLLDKILVVKTPTPDFDGDAIGGTIEIKSLSAFDRKDALRLRVEAGLGDIRGKINPRASAQWTKLLADDTIGIALAASYYKRFAQSDDLRNDEGIVCNRAGVTSGSPLSDFPCAAGSFIRPEEIDQRALIGDRERYGGTLNIEFRPNDTTQLYIRGTATRFTDNQLRFQQEIEPRRATDRRDVRVVGPNSGTLDGVDFERQAFTQTFDDKFYALSGGGEHRFGPWSLAYQGDWSKVTRSGNGERIRFRERRGILTFAADGNSVDFTSAPGIRRSGDPSVLANYDLDQVLVDRESGSDKIYSFRGDVGREFEFGDANKLTFRIGGKFRQRDKSADVDEFLIEDIPTIVSVGGGVVDATPTLADFPLVRPSGTRLTNFPAFPTIAALQPIFDRYANAVPGTVAAAVVNSNREDFDAREKVTAGYGMATVELGENTKIVGGLRVENTKFNTVGNFVIDVETGADIIFAGTAAQNSYTDVMPSIIMKHDMGNFQFRAAWTNAIQRGNFEDINNVQLGTRADSGTRTIGLTNPDLDPAKAFQLDAGFGWFPNRNTSIQVTGFYKRIKDFIVDATFNGSVATGRVDIGNLPGVAIPLPTGLAAADRLFDQVEVPLNGEVAKLYGIEFGWSQNYTFLPGALSNLFTTANVTWAKSSSDLGFRPGANLPFPGQPKWTANASLGYENDDFSVRTSLNYRSTVLNSVADVEEEDTLRKSYLGVDFSLRFTFIDGVQIYFDASNLTNERDERYYRGGADGPLFERIERFGRTFQLGARVSF
jgi:iron complex outermembrane recepter protein